jgi:thiol-disulfide isomerase/thioredoxin
LKRKVTTLMYITLVLFLVFLLPSEGVATEEKSYDDLYTSLQIQRIDPSPEAPDFTLRTLEDKTVSLSDYRGKVVFLNFWATWCGPCRSEMPSMEKLGQRFLNDAFIILAVDLREGEDEVASFVEEYGLTFSVLFDSSGAVGEMYGVRGIPTTFFIDPEGKVVGGAVGTRDWASDDAFNLIEHFLLESE